jgi:hypothetical protein
MRGVGLGGRDQGYGFLAENLILRSFQALPWLETHLAACGEIPSSRGYCNGISRATNHQFVIQLPVSYRLIFSLHLRRLIHTILTSYLPLPAHE